MNWKPQVLVDDIWHSNALCFATEKEAKDNAFNLFMRWTSTSGSRAIESTDTPNYRWDAEIGLVPLPQPEMEVIAATGGAS